MHDHSRFYSPQAPLHRTFSVIEAKPKEYHDSKALLIPSLSQSQKYIMILKPMKPNVRGSLEGALPTRIASHTSCQNWTAMTGIIVLALFKPTTER